MNGISRYDDLKAAKVKSMILQECDVVPRYDREKERRRDKQERRGLLHWKGLFTYCLLLFLIHWKAGMVQSLDLANVSRRHTALATFLAGCSYFRTCPYMMESDVDADA